MDGPMTCEHCGATAPASARGLEMDGWLRLDAWISQTVLGIARASAFCRSEHLSAEMSDRRFL
jgi:hypothetical protein